MAALEEVESDVMGCQRASSFGHGACGFCDNLHVQSVPACWTVLWGEIEILESRSSVKQLIQFKNLARLPRCRVESCLPETGRSADKKKVPHPRCWAIHLMGNHRIH